MIELRLTNAQGRILQAALDELKTNPIHQRLLREIERQIRYDYHDEEEEQRKEYDSNMEFFETEAEEEQYLLPEERIEPEPEEWMKEDGK